MGKRLTPKQDKFIRALIEGKSQREAYKIAYNTARMSDVVIDVKASELLKLGKVSVRYDELRARRDEKAVITGREVLQGIADIARDDISNYLDFHGEVTQVGEDDNGNPIFGYKTVVNLKDSRTISTKNVSEVSVSANGEFRFRLYRADTAFYKLADILGLSKQTLADPEKLNENMRTLAELLDKPLPNRSLDDE